MVQIQFNYVDYDDLAVESRKCYEVCCRHNKPVIVMEPVKGGNLVNLPENAKAVFDELGRYAPVIHSANYSLGIAVFRRTLEAVSGVLKPDFDIEIVETHHNQKADAPSGTAKLLLEAVDPDHAYTPVYGRQGLCGKRDAREIGVHALRGGTEAGTHTVSFFGPDEVFEITHRASSRQIFVNGALHTARRLAALPKGRYQLQDILFGGTQ